MPLRGAGRAIHGGDPSAPHETGHTPPPNGVPLVPKQIAAHPGTPHPLPPTLHVGPDAARYRTLLNSTGHKGLASVRMQG